MSLSISKRLITTFSRNLKKQTAYNLKGKSLSSQLWIQRQLADPYVIKAKKLNYRCRSAFKLLEINEKHKLFEPGQVVVDCGAAPGSWSQVATQFCLSSESGIIVAVDRQQLFPIEGVTVLGNLDFTQSHEKLKRILGDAKVDVLLSDMAPNATGVRSLDTENIVNLAYSVLRFALETSQLEASLLIKLWQCAEVKDLERNVLKYYKSVRIVKPNASRADSAEIYLLAQNFRGAIKK